MSEQRRRHVLPKSKYSLVVTRPEVPAADNVLALKGSSGFFKYIAEVAKLIDQKTHDSVTIVAHGGMNSLLLRIVDTLRDNIPSLHAYMSLKTAEIVEEYTPLEEGLEKVTFKKVVAGFTATLSIKPLPDLAEGWTLLPPLPEPDATRFEKFRARCEKALAPKPERTEEAPKPHEKKRRRKESVGVEPKKEQPKKREARSNPKRRRNLSKDSQAGEGPKQEDKDQAPQSSRRPQRRRDKQPLGDEDRPAEARNEDEAPLEKESRRPRRNRKNQRTEDHKEGEGLRKEQLTRRVGNQDQEERRTPKHHREQRNGEGASKSQEKRPSDRQRDNQSEPNEERPRRGRGGRGANANNEKMFEGRRYEDAPSNNGRWKDDNDGEPRRGRRGDQDNVYDRNEPVVKDNFRGRSYRSYGRGAGPRQETSYNEETRGNRHEEGRSGQNRGSRRDKEREAH